MAKLDHMRCIHCLNADEKWDWDHVMPVSWYPKTTPANLEKWKVPSCVPCNKRYGRIEETLLLRFSAALDPSSPAALGVADGPMRSMDPTKGRSDRDRRARAARKEKFCADLERFREIFADISTDISGEEIEMGDDRIVLGVHKDDLHAMIEKFVRGYVYIDQSRYIEKNEYLQTNVLENQYGRRLNMLIERYGAIEERGPGLVVRRAYAVDSAGAGLFSVRLWDRVELHGVTLPHAPENLVRDTSDILR